MNYSLALEIFLTMAGVFMVTILVLPWVGLLYSRYTDWVKSIEHRRQEKEWDRLSKEIEERLQRQKEKQ